MSGIEGRTVAIQTSPRTIALSIQGRTGTIIESCILADSTGDPAFVASILIGAVGSPQVVRTLWEGEFYVQAAPVVPAPVQTASVAKPNVTITPK